jgi:DNA polymerase/3'-5' exonuclease PolX
MDHPVALGIAEAVRSALSPQCERIEIAGSVRREKAEVKDIEIVALPLDKGDLFGRPLRDPEGIWGACDRLCKAGHLTIDHERLRQGPIYRRYKFRGRDPVVVEIFLAEPGNWGNILAFRTGSAGWNRVLFTRRSNGGCCPNGLRQRGGYLWHRGKLLQCPTEEEFFAAFGVPILGPRMRTEERAQQIARGFR